MSAPILAFPCRSEGRSKIPTPVYYRAGDEYTRVDITGDETKELGLFPGTVVIFLRDFRLNFALHLFRLDCRDRIARLRWHGRTVCISPDSELPEWRPARKVQVYGAMVELYPVGLNGPRSIVYREDRNRLSAPLHPEYRLLYVASN